MQETPTTNPKKNKLTLVQLPLTTSGQEMDQIDSNKKKHSSHTPHGTLPLPC